MNYKESITLEMTQLSKDPKVVFLGQGISTGDRIYGTMEGVPLKKCLEMPIAENLIVGCAIGMALKGLRPVVVFQRMDFMLIAVDAIINHLTLMPKMSGGQFTLPVIIRTIIGSQDKTFDVGEQHKQDFTHIFDKYISLYDFEKGIYTARSWEAKIVVEHKDRYESEIK